MVDIKKKSGQAEQINENTVETENEHIADKHNGISLDKSAVVKNTEAIEWEEQPTENVTAQTVEQTANEVVEPTQQKVVTQQLNGAINTTNLSPAIEGHTCSGVSQVRHSEKLIKAEQKVDEFGNKLNGAIEKSGLSEAANEVTDVLNNFGNKVTDIINGLASGKKM